MAGTGRRNRWRNFKKKVKVLLYGTFKKQEPNWSDLPKDIVECVVGRLCWADRIRIRAVCKVWSVPNRHIPTIDKVPWALSWKKGHMVCECRVLDPLSQEYFIEKDCLFLSGPITCASVYGWVLFKTFTKTRWSYFLYSPFTTEVINLPDLRGKHDFFPLPDLGKHDSFQAAAFSLDATYPKCVIFLLNADNNGIYVKTCSPGDYSWKTLEFNSGLHRPNPAVDAVYANGVFYCLFAGGQLGAFNVELEQWTILVDRPPSPLLARVLVASDADLLMLDESSKIYKFDLSNKRWIYESGLNNHALFIGYASFSAPAVRETSPLANTIFYGESEWSCRSVKRYGSSSHSRSKSLMYRKCVEPTEFADVWIQPPCGGIWRANDLIFYVV